VAVITDAAPASSRAAAAPTAVPVYVIAGAGCGRDVHTRLLADPDVEVVASPRHATLMVVAGALPAGLFPSLRHIHDQIPAPRAMIWATDAPVVEGPGGFDHAHVVGSGGVNAAIRTLGSGLARGEVDGAADLLDSEHPVAWKGVGPFGTGGEGMMGGTPYGRPMAMTDDDLRDGLALDAVPVTLGPFLAALPAGLALHVTFQGDVIASLDTVRTGEDDGPSWPADEPVVHGPRGGPLGAVAHTLWLHDLPGLARRAARLALEPDAAAIERLRRHLRRWHTLDASLRGVGALAIGGLGAHDGDAAERFARRLADAVRSLDPDPGHEPDHTTDLGPGPGSGPGPGPGHGDPVPTRRLVELLDGLLVGAELGAALTTIDSLDLDLSQLWNRAAAPA
jgi:hypothetical protein